jgi:nucleoside 2-deoxyribosyltransferase
LEALVSEYGPEFDKWAQRIKREVAPKVDESAVFVSLTPADPEDLDIKFAVELGMAIMLDKPIVAVIPVGKKVPAKLAAVVDRFVEADYDNLSDLTERLGNEVQDILEDLDE